VIDGSYGPLRVQREAAVATVTIDNPPTNLVDGPFIVGLGSLLDRLDDLDAANRASGPVNVLVFLSADPDFFLMHGDVAKLADLPSGEYVAQSEPNRVASLFQRVSDAAFVSIGLIDGAARGGGCEFLSALDLRYGTERTVIGQPEVPLGILPGAGGTTRLPLLIGRPRALEVILTGRDVSGPEALDTGWLTGLQPSASIHSHVMGIAQRIGVMPPAAVAAVKRVTALALHDPSQAMVAETNALGERMASGAHRQPMRQFLASGGQTRVGETTRMSEILDATVGWEHTSAPPM
jgi:enoyl-CoA hydratase/carnithine racemase